METALHIAFALVVMLALAALGATLWKKIKAGPGNTSQQLMRLRVIAQTIALVLLLGALFLFGRG